MVTRARVEDRTVELGGLQFHYRDWGDPAAPPLVLLHGFTGHARSWDTFASSVQDNLRVLALDQRGHGESAYADDYAPERMMEDVEAFRQALGLERFRLLGLSMGGRNAYAYAAAHPEAVERLVIVDIGPEIGKAGLQRIRTAVNHTSDVFNDPEEAVALMRAGNARAPEAELRHRCLNNLLQRPDGAWTWRYDPILRSPDRPLPQADPETGWAQLRQIDCPTLLVRGEESDVLDREVAERMLKEIRDCRFAEVKDAGHSVPLDSPLGFQAAVKSFLLGGI
jgi:pimeloyl-ACP methyl ester carboxylesterase